MSKSIPLPLLCPPARRTKTRAETIVQWASDARKKRSTVKRRRSVSSITLLLRFSASSFTPGAGGRFRVHLQTLENIPDARTVARLNCPTSLQLPQIFCEPCSSTRLFTFHYLHVYLGRYRWPTIFDPKLFRSDMLWAHPPDRANLSGRSQQVRSPFPPVPMSASRSYLTEFHIRNIDPIRKPEDGWGIQCPSVFFGFTLYTPKNVPTVAEPKGHMFPLHSEAQYIIASSCIHIRPNNSRDCKHAENTIDIST